MTRFGPDSAIPERATAEYRCTFVTPAGAPIDGAAISAITASLYDHGGAVVNNRNAVDVLNDNGGTLTGNAFVLVLAPADTVAVGNAELQPRRLVLRVTYNDGELPHVVRFFVRNEPQIAN